MRLSFERNFRLTLMISTNGNKTSFYLSRQQWRLRVNQSLAQRPRPGLAPLRAQIASLDLIDVMLQSTTQVLRRPEIKQSRLPGPQLTQCLGHFRVGMTKAAYGDAGQGV